MKKIAIIVLTKDKVDLILRLLNSIVFRSKYDLNMMGVYVADTGSSEKNKLVLKNHLEYLHENFGLKSKLIIYDHYNFAAINNDVVKNHISEDTELLLLCNNDIELINDAISETVKEYENRDTPVGTVGARLLFDDLKVQHMGIQMRKSGIPYHLFRDSYFPKEYENKVGNVWGNTGAFMLTSLETWNEIGGLNENYIECFEDVEYNLECMNLGKSNYCAFNAMCYHKESQTRSGKIRAEDVATLMEFYKKIVKSEDIKNEQPNQ